MTKKLIKTLAFLLIAHLGFSQIDVQKEFADAAKQYEGMLASHSDLSKFPQSTKPDGTHNDRKSSWWCSGFFGGSLWYLYEANQEEQWEKAAHDWTMAVEKEQYNTGTHDLGFMIYCPFGNGYRLTQNEAYKPVMLTAAKSLSTRFDPNVGLIKSWNKFQKIYDYPVIIDNMMNLELLFWAAKESGNKEFYDLSITHADNTIKHHFREDNSSFHVVCYDENGNVLAKKTHQGAADESPWSRGQAWGLYGYTVMYRETKDTKYLKQAQKIANFMINHPNLPADKIPYWDFSKPGEERDASAGAISSSALFELADFSKGKLKKQYRKVAIQMLTSLTTPAYKAEIGENNNFILMHSTGHKPGNSEIDTPIVYADYYFLEALHRYSKL